MQSREDQYRVGPADRTLGWEMFMLDDGVAGTDTLVVNLTIRTATSAAKKRAALLIDSLSEVPDRKCRVKFHLPTLTWRIDIYHADAWDVQEVVHFLLAQVQGIASK